MNKVKYTLAEIAKTVEGTVKGDENLEVDALATLQNAKGHQISFLANPKYINELPKTQAGAVLLTQEAAPLCQTNAIILSNPYLAFAKVAELFDKSPTYKPGIDPSAKIATSASVHESAHIGANVVIGENTQIAENVVVDSNTTISDYCVLNANVKIKTNVSIYHDVKIGENSTIHANSVIGADGFGNAKDQNGNWIKVPQLGGVTIGKNVEIGASTTVDRGAIEDTIIHDGVKLDNQIQIGHNVVVGENTAMAAQVGIAGSVKVGKECLFGGQVGIAGHLEIGDHVMIASKSGVTNDLLDPGAYQSTWSAKKHMDWKRMVAKIKRIDRITDDIKELKKKE
jgi:UDP-3-O-[3-hydroxymyristoyl] glucosamine N-acyltransferase